MFVRKKKYDAMVAERDKWDGIAATATKLNHQLIKYNDVLVAYTKELEDKLAGARQDNQRWAKDFNELDLAYDRLETDYDKLREERDHYEERCRYLEDELAHYEAEEEGKYLTREAE